VANIYENYQVLDELNKQYNHKQREFWRKSLEENILNSSILPNERIIDNSYLISNGKHENLVITAADTSIQGGTATHVEAVSIQNDCVITNVYIDKTTLLLADNTAIFKNCVFDDVITMEANAKAHFIGCLFRRLSAVNNAGVAADAYVIGCSRKSGIAHTNVTIIAETT